MPRGSAGPLECGQPPADGAMTLTLFREATVDGVTLGRLNANGVFLAYTLEDVVRSGPKVMHETAIPPGHYRVIITKSQRFGRLLPELQNVPDFTGIRIHGGNTAADTSGCILVGMSKAKTAIGSSQMALAIGQGRIADARAKGEDVWIDVVNPRLEPPAQELTACPHFGTSQTRSTPPACSSRTTSEAWRFPASRAPSQARTARVSSS